MKLAEEELEVTMAALRAKQASHATSRMIGIKINEDDWLGFFFNRFHGRVIALMRVHTLYTGTPGTATDHGGVSTPCRTWHLLLCLP